MHVRTVFRGGCALAGALVLAGLASLQAGCASVQCGDNTAPQFDPDTGATTCTAKIGQKSVQCDPATAKIEGGICVADPAKQVKCGDGTLMDPKTLSCIPNPATCGAKMPPACPPQPGKFAVNGLLSHLSNGKLADGQMVEVRAYEPLKFIKDPAGTMPIQKTLTSNATYCLDGLTDSSGQGLIAIAVTDPNGPNLWMLGGVGQNNVAPGKTFRVDGFIVEKSLVAVWDTGAGYSGGNTFEAQGAYFAKFVDKVRGAPDEAMEKPVAGVTLQTAFGAASDVSFFKNDLMTIDKAGMASDALTGAMVARTTGLTLAFFGKGGVVGGMPVTWERFPGGSAPGVVFVQVFHPAM